MSRFLRKSALFVFAASFAVSSFGQYGGSWRTASDIGEGVRGNLIGTVVDVGATNFSVSPDEDKTSTVTVTSDSVATQYNGFGGMINGAPEIFVGSAGFANVRVGDRVDVRGLGHGAGNILASSVTLLGRPVAAPQTGVGQTRPPNSVSSPTLSQTTPTTSPDRFGLLEGTVRQVNADQGRLVIETGNRQLINVIAAPSTPVNYRGDTYRIANLEQGDRIRITPQSGTTTTTGDIHASSIDVLQSVRDNGSNGNRSVGSLTGKVTAIDRRANTITLDTGRGTVNVDMRNAVDSRNRHVRAADLLVGDQLDLSGSYDGETYMASSVRFGDQNTATVTQSPATPAPPPDETGSLVTVTIYGTVAQSLHNSPVLVIRDESGRMVNVNVLEAFAVRTRSGGYVTAVQLNQGQPVAIRAFRDADGNYIAQTIRIR